MREQLDIDVATTQPAAALMQRRISLKVKYADLCIRLEELFGMQVNERVLARTMQRGTYSFELGLKLALALDIKTLSLEGYGNKKELR